MSMKALVNRYFEEIRIEDTDYVSEGGEHDVAYLLLRIPLEMLRDYQRLKGGKEKELPDGSEFWLGTGLCEKLRDSDKYNGQGHEPLKDILEFLGGDVNFDYNDLGRNDMENIRLSIYEIPRDL